MGKEWGIIMDSDYKLNIPDDTVIDWKGITDDWSEIENELYKPKIDFKTDPEYIRMYGSDIRFKYKYSELSTLTEIKGYIKSTYSEHYTNQNNEVQTLDVWKARGSMTDSCIDTTIKYLMRYGRKGGKNKKDLLKAIHYLVLALGNERS
jgi:hypothetical protein